MAYTNVGATEKGEEEDIGGSQIGDKGGGSLDECFEIVGTTMTIKTASIMTKSTNFSPCSHLRRNQ